MRFVAAASLTLVGNSHGGFNIYLSITAVEKLMPPHSIHEEAAVARLGSSNRRLQQELGHSAGTGTD